MKILADILKTNESIENLKLISIFFNLSTSECAINNEGAKYIAESIKINSRITHLDLQRIPSILLII